MTILNFEQGKQTPASKPTVQKNQNSFMIQLLISLLAQNLSVIKFVDNVPNI